MNDEQLDLARRLAAHPKFSPKRGMVWHHDDAGRGVAVDNGWSVPLIRESYDQSGLWREDGWSLDLTNEATGGVLLGMLDYTGTGWLVAISVKQGVRRWAVYERGDAEPGWGWCPSLAEACARALLAEWETTPATPETTAS